MYYLEFFICELCQECGDELTKLNNHSDVLSFQEKEEESCWQNSTSKGKHQNFI